ncbi:cytochrome c biogenesis protein CcmG, thiol:disulfide interchange protein DsbE [Devosia enhydra]|uniref:Cytochrome c biogenesis protein CcmG, thiol:disulfide interchange protein DsbE n=1 Tax=Devosia enhydra TaxID=665118 RepID=A0A1K2HYS3_9HYPH|nr:DsbE family thiol:disulfide interchange protein [Devosia enhydra]SFZ85186.1 cytochrome c biogenesis protein CcmG, thiol:disulfide interchange protein DsbE [Devosia enhydra]
MRFLLLLAPLAVLLLLVGVFAISLDRDPGLVRSVLIDRPAPQFSLAPVEGLATPGFDRAALLGEASVVNVFASWCIPCRDEHPQLIRLAEETGVRLFGLNQKDAPENARAFLTELGNPYAAIGADGDGRASIEWGVYGVPETFVVNAQGIVTFKHVGPITPQSLVEDVIPAVRAAQAAR